MSHNAWVAGVGMIPFKKPGASQAYDDMGAEAVRLALRDAGCSSVVDSMMPPGLVPSAAVRMRRKRTSVPLSPTKTWPSAALKNRRMSALPVSIAAISALEAGLSRP